MLSQKDSTSLFELISKNKTYLEQWFEWSHEVKTEKNSLDFIEQSLRKYDLNKAFDVGIWLDDTLIGVVGFHDINWNHHEVEIGYWIGESYQGKGFVSESVKAMMAYAFLEYRLNRVEIKCGVHNTRSRALAEKLGFGFEGIEREGLHFKGRFFDVACYSFLHRDFRVQGEESYVLLARNIRTP